MAKVIVKETNEELFRGQFIECQAFYEQHEGAIVDTNGVFKVITVENI